MRAPSASHPSTKHFKLKRARGFGTLGSVGFRVQGSGLDVP